MCSNPLELLYQDQLLSIRGSSQCNVLSQLDKTEIEMF